MNLKETGAVMDVLTVAYPQFYKHQSAEERLIASKLWADMFQGDDVATVLAAVKALIASDEKGFPPHIGAVKEKIRFLTQPREMTEQEAWNAVEKACRNSLYHAPEEFEKLPPVVQRLVGSPNQLREWAMINADELKTVVASNFMRSYKVRAKSEREYMALPAGVKEFVAALADRMGIKQKMLPDGEQTAEQQQKGKYSQGHYRPERRMCQDGNET